MDRDLGSGTADDRPGRVSAGLGVRVSKIGKIGKIIISKILQNF